MLHLIVAHYILEVSTVTGQDQINHVHLLCTLGMPVATSLMMQALGRRYLQYYKRSYERSKTLWEGHFCFSLVQEETYLLQVYRITR